VVTVGRGRLRVRITAVHDDVENYGSGQVPSRTNGTVELKLTSPAKLWDPTGTLDRISEEESEAEMKRIREDTKEEAGTDRYRGNEDIDARAAESRLRRIVEYVEEKALPADLARVQIALVAKYGLLSEKTIAGFMKLKPPGKVAASAPKPPKKLSPAQLQSAWDMMRWNMAQEAAKAKSKSRTPAHARKEIERIGKEALAHFEKAAIAKQIRWYHKEMVPTPKAKELKDAVKLMTSLVADAKRGVRPVVEAGRLIEMVARNHPEVVTKKLTGEILARLPVTPLEAMRRRRR
jgi:hypothetical protein